MVKRLLATAGIGSVLLLGGTALFDRTEERSLDVITVPEKERASGQFRFGDIPPHTSSVDSNGVISLNVADKKYTIEPLRIETDKAEATKERSRTLKVETVGQDVHIKGVWGEATDITLTNTRNEFSKVVSFTQDDFKALAGDTKYIEVKFQITGFEIPDGIYTNRVEIQPNVWLEKGKAWDSSPGDDANDIPNQNYTDVEFQIIGDTLVKRIPVGWFKTATFPVYTDAVFTFGTKELADVGPSGTVDSEAIGTDKYYTCWTDNTDAAAEGRCHVTSVAGTDLTFGSTLDFSTDVGPTTNSTGLAACAAGTDRWVVMFSNDADGDKVVARIATSTGTTINGYSSTTNIFTGISPNIGDCVYVAADTVLFMYGDGSGSDYEAIACTISVASAFTCGSAAILQNDASGSLFGGSCATIGSGKFACFWTAQVSFARAIVGTVSGTTITLGSSVAVFNNTSVSTFGHGVISPATDQFLMGWNLNNTQAGAALATVSGTTITLGATTTPIIATSTSITSFTTVDSNSAILLFQQGTVDAATTFLAAIPIEMDFTTRTFSTSTAEQVDATTDPGSLHAAKISDCKFAFVWEDDNDTNDLFAIIGDTAGCVVDAVKDAGIYWFE